MIVRIPRAATLLPFLLLAGLTTAVALALGDGKTIFVQTKCNSCHTVSSSGVAAATPRTMQAPDLSAVGARHNAAWIEGFLQKTEQLNGKKHLKKFSGSAADLKTLSTWLASLKKQ